MDDVLSKVLQLVLSLAVALFAVEVLHVAGLAVLQAFELLTTVHRLREEGLMKVERYRTTLWREMKRRFWLAVGLSMVLLYANLVNVDVIWTAVYTIAGALFVTLGWRNLMRGNPLMQMLWGSIARELKETGIDLEPTDHETEVKA